MSIKRFCMGVAGVVAAAAISSIALAGCASMSIGPSPDIEPHLIAQGDAEPVRPIDSLEGKEMSPVDGELSNEAYRERISELYTLVVEDRARPVFVQDDPVKPIYDAAVAVLDRYIRNSWHTDEKGVMYTVHSIHDYLVTYITYDFELYESFEQGQDVGDNPAFDIDGVFMNKRAVCDGLSRAFNFLCAIEGIDSMRVTGRFAGGPHAWNKVKIDEQWYNVDVTADSANYRMGDSGYAKQLSHGFYLLSDETIKTFNVGYPQRNHVFESSSQTTGAFYDYEYYADKSVTVGDEIYPCVITTQQMLNNLFSDISAQKGNVGKIEIQLKFPGKVNVNYADMYFDEIKEAYSKLKSSSFVISENQRPYFQYPNGVYLFLMYA